MSRTEDLIAERERTIAIIEEAVAAGEIAPGNTSAVRILSEYRADVATMRAQMAQSQAEWQASLDRAGVMRSGTKTSDVDDSFTRWFVIRRGTIGWAPVLERELGVSLRATQCHSGDWDCCGRFFTHGARVRVQGPRILVTASYSRDV